MWSNPKLPPPCRHPSSRSCAGHGAWPGVRDGPLYCGAFPIALGLSRDADAFALITEAEGQAGADGRLRRYAVYVRGRA